MSDGDTIEKSYINKMEELHIKALAPIQPIITELNRIGAVLKRSPENMIHLDYEYDYEGILGIIVNPNVIIVFGRDRVESLELTVDSLYATMFDAIDTFNGGTNNPIATAFKAYINNKRGVDQCQI